ncbi:MAG TPA: retropepsin-like aspartic protease [Terriglobales bacterium]|nr:retropepsin-like aspartic protease [Terriglobales bacterium]
MKPALPCIRLGWLILFSLLAGSTLLAQEIPLEYCDRLPAIRVEVAGQKPMLFLVDTAASSLLNLHSFFSGDSREVEISSYTGTATTGARQVSLPEMRIGSYRLMGLKMVAIDLSAVGKNCGRRIDGILGADLLEKMGATIDFQRQVAHFMTTGERHDEELVAEAKQEIEQCLAALSGSDEKTVAQCLDPQIALFTTGAKFFRQQDALAYFQQHYFHRTSAAHLEFHSSDFHVIGDAVWFQYEFTLAAPDNTVHARGMAMCHKSDDHWKIANVGLAFVPPEMLATK